MTGVRASHDMVFVGTSAPPCTRKRGPRIRSDQERRRWLSSPPVFVCTASFFHPAALYHSMNP